MFTKKYLFAVLYLANLQASHNHNEAIMKKGWNKQAQFANICALYDPTGTALISTKNTQDRLRIALLHQQSKKSYQEAFAIELKANSFSVENKPVVDALSALAYGGYAKKTNDNVAYEKLIKNETCDYFPKIKYLLLQTATTSLLDILQNPVNSKAQSCQNINEVIGKLTQNKEARPTLILDIAAWLNYTNGTNWPAILPIKENPYLNLSLFGRGPRVEWTFITQQKINEWKAIYKKKGNNNRSQTNARL